MKKILAAITIPGLLLGGAAVASAQTPDDGVTDDSTVVDEGRRHRGGHRGLGDFAEALGLEKNELADALADGQTIAQIAADANVDIGAVIDDIVAEAQARADENPDSELAQNFDPAVFEERLTELVNSEIDPSAHRGNRGNRGPGGGTAIAEALGLEPEALREALVGGQTVAEVAADQGVDINDVIDQIVAEAEARATENPDSPFAENFDADAFEENLTEKLNSAFEPGERRERGPGCDQDAPVDGGVNA